MGWTGCFPAGIVFKEYTAAPEKQLHDGYHHKTGSCVRMWRNGRDAVSVAEIPQDLIGIPILTIAIIQCCWYLIGGAAVLYRVAVWQAL
jgi:hypothetical protein